MPLNIGNIYKLSLLIVCWALPITAHASLQLTEILPDPVGDDSAEWIEIFNNDNNEISTEGWAITVKTRTTKLPSHTILPHQYLVLTKSETGFTLTNTGADISLIDQTNTVVTQLTYAQAPAGQSYALINNSWMWTKKPTPGQENVVEAIETKSVSQAQSAITNPYPYFEVKDIYQLKSGAKATVSGVVVALPAEVGEHFAFVDGLQLNLTVGSWPALAWGDVIKVKGSASHTKTYGTRLNVRSPDDINVLKNETPPEPLVLNLADIDELYEGRLIKTSGLVANKGSNWFTIESDDKTLHVTLKNRELSWPKLSADNHIEITGLITLSDGELRLWPRVPQDIILNQPTSVEAVAETIDLSKKEPTDWRGYIVLIFLGLILLIGWLWEKGKLAKFYQKAIEFLRQKIKH